MSASNAPIDQLLDVPGVLSCESRLAMELADLSRSVASHEVLAPDRDDSQIRVRASLRNIDISVGPI